MTGDHSLDDFLDAGGSEDAEDDPQEGPDEADDESPASLDSEPAPGTDTDAEPADADPAEDDEHRPDPDTVDPAEPTYDWSPDGADCAGCGEQTTTRWRQDGAYVCADCKEW